MVCCGLVLKAVENYLRAVVDRRLVQPSKIVQNQIPFCRSISFLGIFHIQDFEAIDLFSAVS